MNAGVALGNTVNEAIEHLALPVRYAGYIRDIGAVCLLEGRNLGIVCMYGIYFLANVDIHCHIFVKPAVIHTDKFAERL